MKAKKASPKKTNGKAERVRVIRIVALTNPQTKREALERVTAEGKIASARQAKKFGVKTVKAWTEVEADTWAKAAEMFRAGKGKKVTA